MNATRGDMDRGRAKTRRRRGAARRSLGRRRRGLPRRRGAGPSKSCGLLVRTRRFPRSGAPRRFRFERAIFRLARPQRGRRQRRPCVARFTGAGASSPRSGAPRRAPLRSPLRLPRRGGAGTAPNPGRARCTPAIHRARNISAFTPAARRWCAGGAARLHAKGVESLIARRDNRDGRKSGRPGQRATRRSAFTPTPSPARSKRRFSSKPRRARVAAGADWRRWSASPNHLGDFGAICNDAAFALMHAHTGVWRERTLRAAEAAFGHRLMMDAIVPGGVASILGPDGVRAIRAHVAALRPAFKRLVELYDKHRLAARPHRRDRRRRTGNSSKLFGRGRFCRARLRGATSTPAAIHGLSAL